MFASVDTLAVNTIRTLSIDAIEKQNPVIRDADGSRSMAYALWTRHMNHNPKIRTGLTAIVSYFLQDTGPCFVQPLHLSGYDVSMEDIKEFRQWGSKTPTSRIRTYSWC